MYGINFTSQAVSSALGIIIFNSCRMVHGYILLNALSQPPTVRPLFGFHFGGCINRSVLSILMLRAFLCVGLLPLDTFPEVGLLGHRMWTFLWLVIHVAKLRSKGRHLFSLCVFDNGLYSFGLRCPRTQNDTGQLGLWTYSLF